MKFLSYDSRFSQILIKLSYTCWLNLLWIICSLPVFTIGASTTALYTVTLKMADDKESEITKTFFRAFKDNFAQATRIWLILLVIGAVLGGDGYVAWHMRSQTTGLPAVLWTLNLALLIVAGIAYVIVMLYIFPLIARFVNNDRAMLKNAFLIGIHYLFCTIVVFFIHFAMFYLVVAIFTPFIIFGEGLVAYLSSLFLINVLRLCSGTAGGAQE